MSGQVAVVISSGMPRSLTMRAFMLMPPLANAHSWTRMFSAGAPSVGPCTRQSDREPSIRLQRSCCASGGMSAIEFVVGGAWVVDDGGASVVVSEDDDPV